MEVRGLRADGFPNNPLTRPLPSHRGLPQQSSPQQLLNLQGNPSASLLNGSMLQRALLLQQLQGMVVLSSPGFLRAPLSLPSAHSDPEHPYG